MVGTVSRSIGAVILGLIVALVFVIGVEGMSAILHPFPPGVDHNDLEACKTHVANYPGWVLFLLGVLGWGLATFSGSWVATRLGTGRHFAHGIVTGLILFAAAIANMLMLPYPIWFSGLNLIVLPICFVTGSKLGQAKPLS